MKKTIILLIISLICGVFGVLSMIRGHHEIQRIFTGHETSQQKILVRSIISGLSAAMIFLSVELFWIAFQTGDFITIKLSSLLIGSPLILGIIVALGFVWQVYITGRFRGHLIHKLTKKTESKKKRKIKDGSE